MLVEPQERTRSEMEDTRERVWVVLAMRRSGHHAVVNQLCYQLSPVVHLNNCVIRGLPRRAQPRSGRFRHYQGGEVRDVGTQSRRRYRRSFAELAGVPNLVYSFEDADLAVDYARFVEPHRSYVVLCVVRDPFNWLASSMRYGQHLTRNVERRIERWQEHVEQCLRPQRYPFGEFVDVNYNRWVSDQSYRVELSRRLAVAYREEGREEVVVFGIGSSFDGGAYDGRGTDMKVLERWQSFAENPRYRSLLGSSRLIELSQQYFQFNPL